MNRTFESLYCVFRFILLLCVIVTGSGTLYAQDKKSADAKGELPAGAKKGWSVAPFPVVGYVSDLGFQYGAYGELYNFGDGSKYPAYRDKFCVEVSNYTKGSSVFWFFYDSPELWKNHRVTFDLGYFPDRMCDFYGFNGYMAPYKKDENNSFYKVDRKQLRLMANIQGNIVGKLRWMAGIAWQRMMIRPVTLKKFAGADNLYSHYILNGLIRPDEAKGGNVLQWKTGLIYDTRDREADPTRGFYGEAIIAFAPDWIDRDGYSFIKTNVSLSYFQPLLRDVITLAGRVGAQFTPFGEAPFYIQSNINTFYLRQTYSEGLGGNATLRGVLRNRVVGNGMGWVNLELRFRSPTFRLFRQTWYAACNPFIDGGGVLQPYRRGEQVLTEDPYIYSGQPEKIHIDAGIGLKLVMNYNFVLTGEWGKAFDSRDGISGMSFGLNYLF